MPTIGLKVMKGQYPMTELVPVTNEEIINITNDLKCADPGHDGIDTKVIKETS